MSGPQERCTSRHDNKSVTGSSMRGRTGAKRVTCLARPEAFPYFFKSFGKSTAATSLTASSTRPNVPFGTARITNPVLQYATALRCTTRCFLESSGTRTSSKPWTMGLNAKSTTFKKQPNVPCKDAMLGFFAVTPIGETHCFFVDAFMRPLLEATARLLHRLGAVAFVLAFAQGQG